MLLSSGRGGVTLGVAGHEVEADVTLESGGVGTSPVVGGWDRVDGRDLGLEVLGETNERVTLGHVVAVFFFMSARWFCQSEFDFPSLTCSRRIQSQSHCSKQPQRCRC